MWNLQLNDSCLSCAHNFLFSELSHMYNLIWAPPKSCDVHVVNPWNQISHKGQVFSWQEAPRLQTSQKRQYKYTNARAQRKKKKSAPFNQDTSRSPTFIHSLCLSAHLRMLGAPSDSVRADKAPAPNPISGVSQCCRLSQWPDVGWSAQQQGAADVLYNTSRRKETAFWGILGFFFFFFCGGVETHIFLNQGESCLLSHKSMCEWFNPPLLLCVVVTIWLRDFDVVKL